MDDTQDPTYESAKRGDTRRRGHVTVARRVLIGFAVLVAAGLVALRAWHETLLRQEPERNATTVRQHWKAATQEISDATEAARRDMEEQATRLRAPDEQARAQILRVLESNYERARRLRDMSGPAEAARFQEYMMETKAQMDRFRPGSGASSRASGSASQPVKPPPGSAGSQ